MNIYIREGIDQIGIITVFFEMDDKNNYSIGKEKIFDSSHLYSDGWVRAL